jgi:hypothetical protein
MQRVTLVIDHAQPRLRRIGRVCVVIGMRPAESVP